MEQLRLNMEAEPANEPVIVLDLQVQEELVARMREVLLAIHYAKGDKHNDDVPKQS